MQSPRGVLKKFRTENNCDKGILCKVAEPNSSTLPKKESQRYFSLDVRATILYSLKSV